MKKFLLTLIAFILFLGIISELTIRVFRLVPDIPERYVDENSIQRYKPLQSGYYTKAKSKWHVNDFGWLGTDEFKKDSTITIIGDSYIENIMNPIECNQGSILKQHIPNFYFFEAGRSGITFIETMEISSVLDKELNPKYQVLYLNEMDFVESIAEINRYKDRLQISVEKSQLLHSELKSPGLKKILYNFKLAYYLYLRFPILVRKENKGEVTEKHVKRKQTHISRISKLLKYCHENYELDKLIFAFHPNTNSDIIELVKKYNIKVIELDSSSDKSWALGSHDGHWSCYGHNQVSKQVAAKLKEFL